jgi:tetratricopeptide (TPR) repeat protein
MTPTEMLTLALQRHQAGDFAQAESLYRQFLSHEPNHPDALHLLGIVAYQTGRHAAAEELLNRAVALRPATMEYHFDLGLNRKAMGRDDEAVASFVQAASLPAPSAQLLHKLAMNLTELHAWEPALACANRALAANPDDAAAVEILGRVASDRGDYRAAATHYRRVVRLRPDVPILHWNLGRLLLALGEFEEGWREFEWRTSLAGQPGVDTNFSQPRWDGGSAAGMTLLAHAEGGFGDALQFVRYVPRLRDRAARVILQCHSSLISLFKQVPGIDQIIPRYQEPPPYHRHVPLISLPRIFGTNLGNIPSTVPYLTVPADRLAHWAGRVPADKLLNVGLVWKGNVQPELHDLRSANVEAFAPLAHARGVRFFSLQVGAAPGEASRSTLKLIDHTAALKDFAETAALIRHLDLVISIDTSVAHLAGALAIPTWLLVARPGDFRWLLDRSDSPWYATMRIFRQTARADWTAPIAEVAKALAIAAAKKAGQ